MKKISMLAQKTFRLETLVDFPDDALAAKEPISSRDIDCLMSNLHSLGIRRVSWGYYGDGHGGYLLPSGFNAPDSGSNWRNYTETLQLLGNPLRVAAETAHRYGMELYAYYKPYETGPALSFPEGSSEAQQWGKLAIKGGSLAWLDPFVVKNPTLRIGRRTDNITGRCSRNEIHALKLTKKDASPTRITKTHLQIWVSSNNYHYRLLECAFNFQEKVELSLREITDWRGELVTKKGDPTRVLILSGFRIPERFILVTTDFVSGTADFENTGTDLLTASGPHGEEIPGVFSNGGAIWDNGVNNFRDGGLFFDTGFGKALICLDECNVFGAKGVAAYTAGRNEYLPGALCETEPQVRSFWLDCIKEMLAANVDGVDFRVENHSTHTDYADEYGFNDIALEQCAGRTGSALLSAIAKIRGEAYTEFLRQAKKLIAAQGKRMRINLNIDWFRPDPPPIRKLAYPANITFNWPTWIKEGLLDEAIMRIFEFPFAYIFDDSVAQTMIACCQERNIPISVNRYLKPVAQYLQEFKQVLHDGRFSGFIFYETESFFRLGGGRCFVDSDTSQNYDAVMAACKEMSKSI